MRKPLVEFKSLKAAQRKQMMSATPATEMHSEVSGFFLGSASLHAQMLAALRLLEKLKRNGKDIPNASQAVRSIDLPAGHVRKLIRLLADGGLLIRQPGRADAWALSRAIDTMTLDDVYTCLTRASADAMTATELLFNDNAAAELLLMQATMTVNLNVAQQLRLFDLGRIVVAGSGMISMDRSFERASVTPFS